MHEVPSVRAKPCMLVMPGIPRMHARQTDAVIPGIPGYITHPERIRAILPCTALVSADDYKESSRGIMQRRLRRLVDAERSRGRHGFSVPHYFSGYARRSDAVCKTRQRVCRTPASRSRGASTRSCCRVVNAEADAADAASGRQRLMANGPRTRTSTIKKQYVRLALVCCVPERIGGKDLLAAVVSVDVFKLRVTISERSAFQESAYTVLLLAAMRQAPRSGLN
jgi:hypothetical protein